MTRTDSRYERLDAIERQLARNADGLTTGELAREFGVDADTIRRDLAELDRMGAGTFKVGRRYLLDHRRSFHSVRLNNDEALVQAIVSSFRVSVPVCPQCMSTGSVWPLGYHRR